MYNVDKLVNEAAAKLQLLTNTTTQDVNSAIRQGSSR